MKFSQSHILRRGFTLIELLTVIALIGILTAIVIPVLGRVRESSHSAACQSNLRQLGQSLLLFATGNAGRLPGESAPRWDYAALSVSMPEVAGSVAYSSLLRCPSDENVRSGANVGRARSYGYNPVLCNPGGMYGNESMYGVNLPAANQGILLDEIIRPSRVALLIEFPSPLNAYDRGDYATRTALLPVHQGGMNVVFTDGSVQHIKDSAELQRSGAHGLRQFVNLYMRNSP